MSTVGIVADILMVVGGARLTTALLMRVWRTAARLCAGSPLDHATRRLTAWVLR